MSSENRPWWSVRPRLLGLSAVVLLVVAAGSTALLMGSSDGDPADSFSFLTRHLTRAGGHGDGQDKEPSASSALAEGQPAPAFSLPDASGATVSLNEFTGKPVLLYFSMGYG